MKKVMTLGFCFLAGLTAFSQNKDHQGHRNFPVIVTLQFHSLSLPFKNLKSNFSNMGIGVGTEVSHNSMQNWVQQFNMVWYRNKTVGNGINLSTQTVWRPTIVDNFYGEIRIGIGYQYSYRPVESFRQVNGKWVSTGKKGKGMLAIPAGISLGFNDFSTETYLSPFVGYQFVLMKGYSKSIPLVPETFIQVGSRIHF